MGILQSWQTIKVNQNTKYSRATLKIWKHHGEDEKSAEKNQHKERERSHRHYLIFQLSIRELIFPLIRVDN